MIIINDQEFLKLVGYIKTNFGIDLFKKKGLLEGRLSIMLSSKGYTNFSDYINDLINDTTGSGITELLNKITTNYTFFMREAKHFQFLSTILLPYLENNIRDNDIRIWSAGCSTGEEPYTLAMIFAEYFGIRKSLWNSKILATDISVKALETAGRGIYSSDALKDLPVTWKAKYFNESNDKDLEVVDSIKNEIIFRVFNLMDNEYPFKKKFHVIFCRNVMIYFDSETRKKLIDQFYRVLEPGGYLFIGHAETINRNESKFKYVIPSVYKKENNTND